MNSTVVDTVHHLSESFAYRTLTPWILISVSLLYVNILLVRLIMWQYRGYRRKKDRARRQRLEQFWTAKMARLNASQVKIRAPEEMHLPIYLDSTVTLVDVPQILRHYTTKEEIQVEDDDRTVIGESRHCFSRPRYYFLKSRRRLTRYKEQQKRRQLLWQWGVSMGYCQYNHGYYMNRIVHKLTENKKA